MRKKERVLISFAGLLFCLAFCLSLAFDAFAKNVANPKPISPDTCVGHRGAMDLAPQNTRASFEQAVKAGYTMIECDLWYTRSRDILVCHQETIKPYTGVNKKIWELTLKSRMKYPIKRGKKTKKFPNMHIMSADEVLDFAAKNNVKLFLHLKTGETTFTKKALRKLNRAIKRHHPARKPVLVSSNKPVIKRLKAFRWERAYLCDATDKSELRQGMDFAARQGCQYLIAPYRKSKKPTRPLIRYGHHKGLKIAYFVKTRKGANRVFRKGGDYVITDKTLFR